MPKSETRAVRDCEGNDRTSGEILCLYALYRRDCKGNDRTCGSPFSVTSERLFPSHLSYAARAFVALYRRDCFGPISSIVAFLFVCFLSCFASGRVGELMAASNQSSDDEVVSNADSLINEVLMPPPAETPQKTPSGAYKNRILYGGPSCPAIPAYGG